MLPSPVLLHLWTQTRCVLRTSLQRGFILVPLVTLIGVSSPVPVTALEFPPTKKGAPARTSGGGARDPKDALTALLPKDGINSFACDQATLLVNVPESLNKTAFLLVMDGEEEALLEQEFQLPSASGLMAVQLPKSITEKMQVNQTYDWEFALLPGGDQTEEQVVRGQFERIDLAAESCAKDDAPLAMAEHFSQLGVWQETILAIAPALPDHVEQWQSLLKSVDLEGFDDVAWGGVISLEP